MALRDLVAIGEMNCAASDYFAVTSAFNFLDFVRLEFVVVWIEDPHQPRIEPGIVLVLVDVVTYERLRMMDGERCC